MLKAIKTKEILGLVLLLLVIRFGFFGPYVTEYALSVIQYLLLIVAVVSLTVGGSILLATTRAERSAEVSKMNQEGTSTDNAFYWYGGLTILGVGIGFYLANFIGRPSFATLFIVAALLIYIYATYFKYIPLINALTVGFLIYLITITPGLLNLLPKEGILSESFVLIFVLADYAILLGILGFTIELIKDCRDLNSDLAMGTNSLPMVLGKERTARLITVVFGIMVGLITLYIYKYLYINTYLTIGVLLLIVAPILLAMFKSWNAESTQNFQNLYKLTMGITAIVVLSLIVYGLTASV